MAQHSAMTLVATPIDLENPFTHIPELSLMTPPPPAFPGLPCDALSVFSFSQPLGGFNPSNLDCNQVILLFDFPYTVEILQGLVNARFVKGEI